MKFLEFINGENVKDVNSFASKKWASDYANFIFLYSMSSKIKRENSVLDYLLLLLAFSFSISVLLIAPFFSLLAVLLLNFFGGKANFDKGNFDDVFLCRSRASLEKFKGVIKKSDLLVVEKEFFDVGNKQTPVFNRSNIFNFNLYFRSFLFSIRDVFLIFRDIALVVTNRSISLFGIVGLYKLLLPRLVHKVCYESSFFLTVKKLKIKKNNFYTGNTDDRFAAIENRFSDIFGVNLICLPHGLEYGFLLPVPMPGKIVYCYTENAAKILRSIYGDGKYIYDELIIGKVLGNKDAFVVKRDIENIQVFSSPRERELVRYIISELENSSVNYTLKLHPLDSFSYYEDLCTSDVLTDSTFYGGLCISPPSTVLLQAIYSGGLAIGVYAHEQQLKDVEIQFPSLVDERINRFVKTSHKDFISYYDEQFT